MGAGLLCLALAACAHYAPRPPDLAALPARTAAVQLDPARVWTTADLLGVALTSNAQVVEAASHYRSALAAARTARVPPSPTLTLTAEYSKDAGGSSPWLLSGLTDIPLDLGGRRSSRFETADLAVLQALYDYGEAVWSVRTALERARIDHTEADQETAAADRLVALRRDREARLVRRVEAGEDARTASLLARTERLAAERRLADALALRAQADAALAKALGAEPAAVRALRLAPATPPATPADLPAQRLNAALSRRDVLRAVADYDLAEAALRLEVAKQYPAVSIGPGYTWERGVTKLPFNLNLALPPRDLNRAAIAEAETKRVEAGRKLETAQAAALAAVDQADAALAAARANLLRALEQDIPTARHSFTSAHASTVAGETDRTDELAAEAVLADAELTALDARRQADLAGADLEDALRRPFDTRELAVLTAAVDSLGAAR